MCSYTKTFASRYAVPCFARWATVVSVVCFVCQAQAGIIPQFSGNHRAVQEVFSHPQFFLDSSFSFAVFELGGAAEDSFGTGRSGFDNRFNPGFASPAFDTSAQYLYVYQLVNDGDGLGYSSDISVTAGPITSWGWWTWLLQDSDGPIGPDQPFGRETSGFRKAAPATLGVPDGFVGNTFGGTAHSSFKNENGIIKVLYDQQNLIEPGETSSLIGFTSNAPPQLFNATLDSCIDSLACGSFPFPVQPGQNVPDEAFIPVDPQATYLRAASEGSLCDTHTNTSIPCAFPSPPDPSPGPEEASIIELASVIPGNPIEAGDWLLLQRVGDFVASQAPCAFEGDCGDSFPLIHGDRPPTLRNMFAVFSGSNVLLDDPEALKDAKDSPIPITDPNFSRVQNAIELTEGNAVLIDTDTGRFPPDQVGDPFNNMTMSQLTDISEDFAIDIQGDLENPTPVLVRVPVGATHLFVGAGDGQFFDNTYTEIGMFENDNRIVEGFGVNIALVNPARLLGDYDLDGVVTAADYTVWLDQLGATGLTLAADGTVDGKVDQSDYNLWKANFGTVVGSAFTQNNAVPEPSSAGLVMVMAIVLTVRNHTLRNKIPVE